MRFIQQIRKASFTVDVYLLKDSPKLGKAGQVVEVKPGYAMNTLIPRGQGILMGEGKYRKVLPILHYQKASNQQKVITPKLISYEFKEIFESKPLTAKEFLERQSGLTVHKQGDLEVK